MARYQKRTAFTLIELLVVVSVIALLVSILLPALSRARKQARTVVCLSCQHQLHLGMTYYADDNNGWFPAMSYGDPPVLLWEWGSYSAGKNGYPIGLGLLYPRHGDDPDTPLGTDYIPDLEFILGCPSQVKDWERMNGGAGSFNQYFRQWGHSYWDYLWGVTDDQQFTRNLQESTRTKNIHPGYRTIMTCRFIWTWEMPEFSQRWHGTASNPLFNRLTIGGDTKTVRWDPRMGPGGDKQWIPEFVDHLQ